MPAAKKTSDAATAVEPVAPANPDLSRMIEEAVSKLPDEEVRSVRVFGNCYRCNWWVQDKSGGDLAFVTGKIRKSSFVRATMTEGKLSLDDSGSN